MRLVPNRSALCLLALALALCLPLGALAQGGVAVTLDDVDTTLFPTVTAHVTVLDQNGWPISGLGADRFELIEDGRASFPPDGLEEVTNDAATVSVLILVDLSATMRGRPLEAAQAATTAFLARLLDEPNDPDRAAFMGFGKQVDITSVDLADEAVEVAFTNDRAALLSVVESLQVDSNTGTPLYDAIYRGVKVTAREPGRRAIIVMTDGQDVGSTLRDGDPIAEAQRQRVPIFPIGLSNSRLDRSYLTRLAELTGGQFQEAPTPEALEQKFAEVLSHIKRQYLLSYDSRLPQADGQYHSLLVRVSTGAGQGFAETKFLLGQAATAQPTAAAAEPTLAASPVAGAATAAAPATAQPVALAITQAPESAPGEAMQETGAAPVNSAILIAIVVVSFFLLLMLVLLVVWLVRRRSGRAEPAADAFEVPPPRFERPQPSRRMADLDTGSGTSATSFDSGPGTMTEAAPPLGAPPVPPAGPPAVTPFGSAPAKPTSSPSPFAAKPPAASTPFGLGEQGQGSGTPAPPGAASDEETVVMPGSAGMRVFGILIDRKQPSHRHDVDKPNVSIGRAGGNAIVLNNPTVSRQHAAIRREGDAFVLHDLDSANGTFVGDQRLREPVRLEDGMVLRFGELEFVFKVMSLE